MIGKLEEWIASMRQAHSPGPAVRIIVTRYGRDMGWSVDLTDETDLGQVADHLDTSIRQSGFHSYELRAVDAEGRMIAPFAYRVEAAAQIMPAGSGVPALPSAVEDTVYHALQSSRSFAGVGLKALIESHEIAKGMISRLEKENASLRHENADLRGKLTAQWDLADKLSSNQLDKQIEADRSVRQGRIAETLTNAALARLFGRASPEGQTIEQRMAMSLLRSINPEQVQKILPLLSEDQRLALMELIRQEQAKADAAPPKTPHDAAAAAAMVNGVNGKEPP